MKGAIEWMARNPVAANILLVMITLSGIFMTTRIRQEVFPDIEINMIRVTVIYPGAGPSDVESSICKPLEEAITELEGIDSINCTSNEESAGMVLDIEDGHDLQDVLLEVKNAVDSITTFPEDIDPPTVARIVRRRHVVAVSLSGDVPEETLFEYAEGIKEGFLRVDGLNYVQLEGTRAKEIRIEITPETLNQHGLTLQEIATKIKQGSLDLPAGSLRSGNSQIFLRTKALKEKVEEFAKIEILTNKSGVTLYLGDIATLTEDLRERDDFSTFDGKPSVMFDVYQSPNFSPDAISKKALQFIEEQNQILPPNLKLIVWNDRSKSFSERFDLMIRNAAIGLTLVFVILTLFLEIRLAFWVMLAIPVSFLGSLIILVYLGVSINMISMFAFILVLGIVVDDAIVIGERIFQLREQGKDLLTAAVEGVLEMAPPVTIAILTTMVAFAPLNFIEGRMGAFLGAIPVIVICVIGISLVEALLVLPAHLAHGNPKPLPGPFRLLDTMRHGCDRALRWVIDNPFQRLLNFTINNRYATIATGITCLMLSLGLVEGGIIPVKFFPSIEGDNIRLTIELPMGYPADETEKILRDVERKGIALLEGIDQKANNGRQSLEHISSRVQVRARGSGATTATIRMRLANEKIRNVSTFKFSRMWRSAIEDTPDIRSITIRSRGMHFADDINISLSHQNSQVLKKIKEEVKEHLEVYEGVKEIIDSEKEGNREFQFSLTKEALTMGITPQLFAANLRDSFQGIKALTLIKARNNIPVRVSFPKAHRENLNKLETILLKAPNGGMISMADAATIKEAIEPISIRRIDQRRVVNITAAVEEGGQSLDIISDAIKENYLPGIRAEYPKLTVKMEGSHKQRMLSLDSLWLGFAVALLGIYALLAIFFKSYIQPFIVMSAIPFGIAGAVVGHLILGQPISFLSLFGLIGLTGVVVNDSLILMDAINRHPQKNSNLNLAVLEAAKSRFRPIILTSVTTFAGLMPILTESSRQAQFLIPMAISLGVGIMFATLITLILIPSFYLIHEDFKS